MPFDHDEDVIVPAPVSKKWDDEDEEDNIVKDSWDASDSEEEEKKPAPAPPKKRPIAQRIAERKEEEELAKIKRFVDMVEEEDEFARKERLHQLEIEADMANTAELFAGVGVKDENLTPLEKMTPKTKDQFDEFQKALVEIISKHQKQGFYTTFLENLFRELSQPLNDFNVRKLSTALTTLSNDKQRQTKIAQQNKKKGPSKPALGGGGAKIATKGVDMDYQGAVYEDEDEYDDFM